MLKKEEAVIANNSPGDAVTDASAR
jgi:hypothetical protein